MAGEWTPLPNTEHLREPLDEWDDEPLLGVRPHRQDFETATKIEDGLSPAEIKAGMPVTVSINRRTLERTYIDRVFHVMAVTGNNVLIKQGWSPDQIQVTHLITLAEYALYDATPIMDAINK